MQEFEQIVFVDKNGKPTGTTGPKLTSHNASTKLHLAFSCYIFHQNSERFLLTQRALTKKVWPGVWTNSVCGHPMPGESLTSAISRRAKFELNLNITGLHCVLDEYVYKTPLFNGIVEHEFCPVFVAYTQKDPKPNPQEVAAWRWIKWQDYAKLLEEAPDSMSYWAKDQYKWLAGIEPFKTL